MRSAAASARRVLVPAALLVALSNCESAGTVAPADAPAPARTGMVFELSPAAPAEGEEADACAVPLSSRYHLADGKWQAETRWRAECVDQAAPSEIVTYASSGRYVLRGDTITFSLADFEGNEFEEESGILTSESLTIWGHCEGETQYVRVDPAGES